MKKRNSMIVTTGIYLFCALLWAANCLLKWREGALDASTALFGVSAVCFLIAAVLNIIRIRQLPREEKEEK